MRVTIGRQPIVARLGADTSVAITAAARAEAAADLAEALALLDGNYATVAAGAAATSAPHTFVSKESGRIKLYDDAGAVLWTPASQEDIDALTAAVDAVTASLATRAVITEQGTLTVGVDQPTLADALEVLDASVLRYPVSLQLPSAQATSAVTIPLEGLTLRNPRLDLVEVVGAAFGGGANGVISRATGNALFNGTRAADEAALKTKFPTVILIDGDDTVASADNLLAGLAHTGIAFKRCGVIQRSRYPNAHGYDRGHVNAGTAAGRFRIEDCGLLGGVWSLFTYGGTIVLTGTNFIGRAISAAPIGNYHGRVEIVSGETTLWTPDLSSSDGPKYGCFLYGPAAWLEVGDTATFNLDGPSLDGLRVSHGAHANILGTLNIKGAAQPLTMTNGAEVDIAKVFTFSDIDPADSSMIAGPGQEFEPANGPPYGALIHVGAGCQFSHRGGTMTNVQGYNALRIAGGRMTSYWPIEVSDYAFSDYFAFIIASQGNTGALRASSPKGTNGGNGSKITVPAYGTGGIILNEDFTAHGLTSDPVAVDAGGRFKVAR